jgi:hypothetical protein
LELICVLLAGSAVRSRKKLINPIEDVTRQSNKSPGLDRINRRSADHRLTLVDKGISCPTKIPEPLPESVIFP